MSNHQEMQKIVCDLAARKSRQDLKGALDIYHADAELVSPSFQSIAKGHIEIEEELRLFFGVFPDYQVSLEQIATNDQVLLARGSVSMSLSLPNKMTSSICLPTYLEFELKDGRISREVFALDAGLLFRQAGVTPKEFKTGVSQLRQQFRQGV